MEDSKYTSDPLKTIKRSKLFPLLEEIKGFENDELVNELYSSLIRMLKKTIIPALRGYDRTEFEIVVPDRFEPNKEEILTILREAHEIGYEIAYHLKDSVSPFEDVVNILAYCVEEMGVNSNKYRDRVDKAMQDYTVNSSLFTPPSEN